MKIPFTVLILVILILGGIALLIFKFSDNKGLKMASLGALWFIPIFLLTMTKFNDKKELAIMTKSFDDQKGLAHRSMVNMIIDEQNKEEPLDVMIDRLESKFNLDIYIPTKKIDPSPDFNNNKDYITDARRLFCGMGVMERFNEVKNDILETFEFLDFMVRESEMAQKRKDRFINIKLPNVRKEINELIYEDDTDISGDIKRINIMFRKKLPIMNTTVYHFNKYTRELSNLAYYSGIGSKFYTMDDLIEQIKFVIDERLVDKDGNLVVDDKNINKMIHLVLHNFEFLKTIYHGAHPYPDDFESTKNLVKNYISFLILSIGVKLKEYYKAKFDLEDKDYMLLPRLNLLKFLIRDIDYVWVNYRYGGPPSAIDSDKVRCLLDVELL